MECTAKKEKVTSETFSVTLEFEGEREASVFQAMMMKAHNGPVFPDLMTEVGAMASKIENTCEKAWSANKVTLKRKPRCPHCGSINVLKVQRNYYKCTLCEREFDWGER